MSTSKLLPWVKNHCLLLTIVVVIILTVISLIGESKYNGNKTKLSVSPETEMISTSTSQVPLSFKLEIKSSLPVFSSSLKTVGIVSSGLKVPLIKQADGSFIGTVQVPLQWLSKPQTITFGLYINGIKTFQTIRFAVTDVSLNLPPDPAEAGKLTLAGIDSDHDGVRDDLEREIVFMYPGNDQVRRVLRAMVKKEQLVVTSTGDHEYFKELEISSLSFYDCANYLIFGNNVIPKITNANTLTVMVQNTSERYKNGHSNYLKSLPFLGPSMMYGTATNNACTQPLVQGQY